MLLNSLLASYADEVKDESGNTLGYLYKEVWTEYAKNCLTSVFLYAAIEIGRASCRERV